MDLLRAKSRHGRVRESQPARRYPTPFPGEVPRRSSQVNEVSIHPDRKGRTSLAFPKHDTLGRFCHDPKVRLNLDGPEVRRCKQDNEEDGCRH